MKKIRTYMLLSILACQLGVGTTVALATELEGSQTTEQTNQKPEQVESPRKDGTTEISTPTEETKPAEDIPVEDVKPGETKPTEEIPAEEVKPGETKPTEEIPAEEIKPGETKPTEEIPAEEIKPGETKPTEEIPAEEIKPSETKPSEEKPKPEKPTTNKPVVNNPKPVKPKVPQPSPNGTVIVPTQPDVVYGPQLSNEVVSEEPIRFSVIKSTQEFINAIGESSRKVGQEKDLYASVMIAQAILESASGQSDLASEPNYNLFGIKGEYEGKSVSFNTLEDNGNGQMYGIQAKFRKYPSYKESLEDYGDLMDNGLTGNPDFYKGVTKKEAKNYKNATKYLTGRYATDTRYNQKLDQLIETYDLTYFDQPVKKGKRKVANDKEVETFDIMNPETKKYAAFTLPLNPEDYVISSGFGVRGHEHHDGIDLAIPANTPVYVSGDGKVIDTGYHPSAGNYVIVEHANGLFTNYFHLNKISVRKGETLSIGNVVGLVGSTGNSTGPHLHFGISMKQWDSYLNPSSYFEFEKEPIKKEKN